MASNAVNVIYLHSHDTGRYVQPYGHAIETPHLQRLAEEGVLFRKAFCANPTCSPSRACLLTGMYAHNNGMVTLAHRGGRLNDYNQHMAATFNAAGYETLLAGVHHVSNGELTPPYQRVVTPTEHTEHGVTDAVVEFLAGPHEKPFFLACGYGRTHRTQHSRDKVQWHNHDESPLGEARYCLPPAPLPDTPETRADFADYKVCATRLDALMGRVIDAVDQAGLREQTLIICTTDHGIAFPHMKCNLTDHGIGVMLIMRGPGGFAGGQCIPALVSQIDIFPTLCELLGIERPAWLQGESLLPLVNGKAASVRDAIFAEVNYHASYEPMRCVRTERYKYIRRLEPHPHPVLANCDDSPSKRFLLANGWRERPQVSEALHDLYFDPNEAGNLIADTAYASILEEMRHRLDAWLEETDDPFRHGHVPTWPGSVVNPITDESPRVPRSAT